MFFNFLFVLLLIFSCASGNALATGTSPSGNALATGTSPTLWPEKFSINFVSNITTDELASTVPITGIMYYDWSKKTQRIDHGAGSYECVNFYNSSLACTLYFTPEGLYRVLAMPLPEGQEECCLGNE